MFESEPLLSDHDAHEIIQKDKDHLWHHLIQHKVFASQDPKIFVEGEGAPRPGHPR